MLTSTHLSQAFDNTIDDVTVDHNRLLSDLLDSNLPLIDIALNHKLTLAQLLVWSSQPAVRHLLAAAAEVHALRANFTLAQSRHIAITLLSDHCRTLSQTPRDRDLASRAARSLLRAGQVDPPPAHQSGPGASEAPPPHTPP
ncbi:MAG: hypothetical protein KF678_14385, partial [Phycisphaeraceae bacterium]|nr:hypothetical protein [Phycisphaeraceae bacterium]